MVAPKSFYGRRLSKLVLIAQVLAAWVTKFDAIYRGDDDNRRQGFRHPASAVSEMVLSKEQLYEMFQNILGIRRIDHQLLYNACQVLWNVLLTSEKQPHRWLLPIPRCLSVEKEWIAWSLRTKSFYWVKTTGCRDELLVAKETTCRLFSTTFWFLLMTQLDNTDEQAAAIRRELEGRLRAADRIEVQNLFPKFYRRPGESEEFQRAQYINELRSQVCLLWARPSTAWQRGSLNKHTVWRVLVLFKFDYIPLCCVLDTVFVFKDTLRTHSAPRGFQCASYFLAQVNTDHSVDAARISRLCAIVFRKKGLVDDCNQS